MGRMWLSICLSFIHTRVPHLPEDGGNAEHVKIHSTGDHPPKKIPNTQPEDPCHDRSAGKDNKIAKSPPIQTQ